jgi:hypothetical protein
MLQTLNCSKERKTQSGRKPLNFFFNPNWVDENIFHVVEKLMDTILEKGNGTQTPVFQSCNT